jgi:hypothetical protein
MGSGISTRRRTAREKLEGVVAENTNVEEQVSYLYITNNDFIQCLIFINMLMSTGS